MTAPAPREIPFNYTSADDRQAVTFLLGEEVWKQLEDLRARRVTGRSARLLMRFLGEVLIHRRNPFLYEELVSSRSRRRKFFENVDQDLSVIEDNAAEPQAKEVLAACRKLAGEFRSEIEAAPDFRARLKSQLGAVVGKENVLTDPFTLVSHATDATDWRLHLPVAVVMPSEEAQVGPLLATIGQLGLRAIPRGAGTGLTGGAVPLRAGCVVVNTEKLNRIRSVSEREFSLADGRKVRSAVMELEAGVITEHAMNHAAERGLVFATDPTSAWACSIGGNIAENAGGKTCVLWGTCIDNLLAWRLALPDGSHVTIHRVDHQLRKILPADPVTFEVRDARGEKVRTVALTGAEIRKNGLWKDITNKALKGLPGVQKEGTDGVITSAAFVLYQAYEASTTLCLEFFGPDMDEASRVILDLAEAFPNRGEEVLQALEHFDDQYVRAIQYKVKAPRPETPKAVLLIDVVGHAPEQVARGVETIRRLLEPHENTYLFVARDAEEGTRFWQDRKKLGAIAKRTNAFKLNEDIVLPLTALAEFARFCDAVNVEEERYDQGLVIARIAEVLGQAAEDEAQLLSGKVARALARCEKAEEALRAAAEKELRALTVPRQLLEEVRETVAGYEKVEAGLEAAFEEARARRIVIATHMHAGDGNVHVNIPVLSNDRAMMRRAEATVDRVMEKVAELGGVCSGEHGIGVTKIKYLDRAIVDELTAYRREVDPAGMMNPGKLQDVDVLEQVFTPSFNLLELEARILQHGQLGELAAKIATCVRCGRCKPDCCVFHPARGLFFHPRNKNLAIGALIEALLYDSQRERSASFELLRYLEEVADHCTICHKCVKHCPVSIDTGDVSVLEREILMSLGFKHTKVATRATLKYLESRSEGYNAAFRLGVVRLGGFMQRAMAKVLGPLQDQDAAAGSYPLQMVRSPLARVDARTLHDVLPHCEPDQALVLEPEGEATASVFYFPGCGSERLFSSVSMAAIHVLLRTGTRVVLPPPFICCGFPAYANARTEQHGRQVLRDSILFSQIREMFSYLTFDACIVTCGTCREGLQAMEASKIFGAPVVDVAKFAFDRGLRAPAEGEYLYHTPCHDSLDGKGPQLLRKLGVAQVEAVPHCCSEAGTLALSRPDITDAMLHRKREAVKEALTTRPGGAVMLTNCPSCMQGLSRNAALGAEPRHMAVELARRISGERWMEEFEKQAARARPVQF